LPVAPTIATLKLMNISCPSPLWFGENPPAGAGSTPGPDPGEGGWAKGIQTVLVVVLPIFLTKNVAFLERRDAATRPAQSLRLWPGKSNARCAIKRLRIENYPVRCRLLRALGKESIATRGGRQGKRCAAFCLCWRRSICQSRRRPSPLPSPCEKRERGSPALRPSPFSPSFCLRSKHVHGEKVPAGG
jgi:hypothetical protein